MARGYLLLKAISLGDILKKTSLKVVDRKKRSDRFFLQDENNNTCFVNMSVVYPAEVEASSVMVRTLDFYGKNYEVPILLELFEETGALYYSDSNVVTCYYEDRDLEPNDIVEFMCYIFGIEVKDADFIMELVNKEFNSTLEIEKNEVDDEISEVMEKNNTVLKNKNDQCCLDEEDSREDESNH